MCHSSGKQILPKIQKPPQNSTYQMTDTKQIPYRGPTNIWSHHTNNSVTTATWGRRLVHP